MAEMSHTIRNDNEIAKIIKYNGWNVSQLIMQFVMLMKEHKRIIRAELSHI
jgi:hypothetical protein